MHVTVKHNIPLQSTLDCSKLTVSRVKGAGLQLNLEKCGGQTRKGVVFKTESPFHQTEDVILYRRNQI